MNNALHVPNEPWIDIYMDFVLSLPIRVSLHASRHVTRVRKASRSRRSHHLVVRFRVVRKLEYTSFIDSRVND